MGFVNVTNTLLSNSWSQKFQGSTLISYIQNLTSKLEIVRLSPK